MTVPYSGGGPAAQALAAGQVDLMVTHLEVALSLQASGRAIPIAATGSRPAAAPFDKLPLMKDMWPSFTFDGVMGILAPAGTPAPVLRQLEQQFRQVLRDPAMREALAARGMVSDEAGPPERLTQRLHEKLSFYRRMAEQLGLKPE